MKSNIHVIEHPIIQNKLSELRNKNTSHLSFRNIISEMSALMTYEATRNLQTHLEKIETPFAIAQSLRISQPIMAIAILRAGLPMIEGLLNALPMARIGHIGIYRDKFINNTVEYYFKLPSFNETDQVFLCDPVIATGHTMIAACNRLREYGLKNVTILSLLVSKTGLETFRDQHPDIDIFCAGIEEKINDRGYIIPGVGDIGDRIYGTF
jgi:uracil phosphoribosyltransferase